MGLDWLYDVKERIKVMEKLIEEGKKIAVKAYEGSEYSTRRWLEATPPDSYDNPEYRVRLFVLEGSPPKGYVIADYASATVRVYGVYFRYIKTLRALEVDKIVH